MSIQRSRLLAQTAELSKSSETNAGISGNVRKNVAKRSDFFSSSTIFINLELDNTYYDTV